MCSMVPQTLKVFNKLAVNSSRDKQLWKFATRMGNVIVREADPRTVVNMQEGYQEALLGSVTRAGEGRKQDWEET